MGENKIGLLLLWVGVIIIVISLIAGLYQGSIAAEMMGNMMHHRGGGSFHFMSFLTTAGIGVVAGLVLIGLAEMIQLLHEQQAPEAKKAANNEQSLQKTALKLGGVEKEKIEKLFGQQVKNIYTTPFESLCIVILKQEVASVIKVVDVGGFNAKEVHEKEVIDQVMEWYQLHMK